MKQNRALAIKPNPSSREAEESVLATALMNPELVDKIASWIPEPIGFYYQENQKVWTAILELRREKSQN